MNKITYKWKKEKDTGLQATDGHFYVALRVLPCDDPENDRTVWLALAFYEQPGNRYDQPAWDIALERTFVTKQDAKQWLISKDLEGFAASLRLDAEYADAEKVNPPQD